MTQIVKQGKHKCSLPGWGEDGEVQECTECLRRWVFRERPNPDYCGWHRTTLNYLFFGRLFRLLFWSIS